MNLPRLAVICDLVEENWPSMDLAAEMLLEHLRADQHAVVEALRVCPPMRRRFTRAPLFGKQGSAHNADRLLNRFWDYPRHLRRSSRGCDLFHVCDHSYAQLVHALPGTRTGVFCHDLDAFRCLLEPDVERRPLWFKAMAWRVLRGLQKAAVVFYSTSAVRREIDRHGLLDGSSLMQAPYGIAPEFTPEPAEPDPAAGLVRTLGGAPYLLHVGSCIPRKRIDVLLDAFAGARARFPGLRLVQVGGQWTPAQQEQLTRLGLASAVLQLRGLEREVVGALYRRAALVLLPSEAEGFGLPVIEALACGATVVASDLPVLREVGGVACVYRTPADVPLWVEAICRLLGDPAAAPDRLARFAQARRYSWAAHAQTIVDAYGKLAGGARQNGRVPKP
jgi:glycosyltransferase involved in cell wall biosynthesis